MFIIATLLALLFWSPYLMVAHAGRQAGHTGGLFSGWSRADGPCDCRLSGIDKPVYRAAGRSDRSKLRHQYGRHELVGQRGIRAAVPGAGVPAALPKAGITTIPEFLEQRYDPTVKRIISFLFLLGYLLTYLPTVLYSARWRSTVFSTSISCWASPSFRRLRSFAPASVLLARSTQSSAV